jgi:thiamine biosynthesis lipoprotein
MLSFLLLAVLGQNPAAAELQAGKPWERLSYEEKHMGVSVKFTVYAQDQAIANKAARAAFDRVGELDRIMSDYNPESELRRLCDNAKPGENVKISRDLFFVLDQSQKLSERSDGAFDVTVGPVVRLWRRARRQKELPDADLLKEAMAAVGYQKVKLDKERSTAA